MKNAMAATPIWSGRETQLAAGLTVRRVLPAVARRSVGPFVFFDHFGPATLPPDLDTDVGPHPHIGLATITYLLEGAMLHRDSLGSVQEIVPGAINWMTAGRGIVHSERTPDALRGHTRNLQGLQLWVALPPALETMAPDFQHVASTDIPVYCAIIERGEVRVRVLLGSAWGLQSPVRTASPTLYLDLHLPPDAEWVLPPLAPEMALYSPSDPLWVDQTEVPARHMLVLPAQTACRLRAPADGARLLLIGGAPLEAPVRMWWNYVSTDPSRIAAAAKAWANGGFDSIPGDATRVDGPPWPGP